MAPRPAPNAPSLAYAGQHWDEDLGLSYAQQRWYQPETGRFLSEDPVGWNAERLGQPTRGHAFGYAAGNPLLYTDPLGLDAGRQAEYGQQDEIYIRLVERYRETGGHISGEEYYTSFQQPLYRIQWQEQYAYLLAREMYWGRKWDDARAQAKLTMDLFSPLLPPETTRMQREMLQSLHTVASVAVLGVAAEAGRPSARGPRPTSAPLSDEMLGSARAQARLAQPAPSAKLELPSVQPEPVRPTVDIPAARFEAGAKKAGRWERYRSAGGQWSRARWGNVFDANQTRAKVASEAADEFQRRLGWGRREVEIDVEGVPRRLDIADVQTRRAYEHKTGSQSLTQDVQWEIERDRILREQGWDIRWRFEGTASKPLLRALDRAGIPVELPEVTK